MINSNEIIGGVASILAVAGVLLNNRKMIACFFLWFVSNFLSGLLHWDAGMYSLMARDAIFLVLTIEGIWRWRKKKGPRRA